MALCALGIPLSYLTSQDIISSTIREVISIGAMFLCSCYIFLTTTNTSDGYFRGAAGWLVVFLIVGVVSTLASNFGGDRSNIGEVFRLLFQCNFSMIAFWAMKRWAECRFNAEAIDLLSYVVLALCVASVGLEAAGISKYEAYGSRYFGFIGDSVAWLVTLPILYFFSRRSILPFLVAVGILLVTQSRGPLAVAAFGCVFLAAVVYRTRKLYLAFTVAGLVIFYLILIPGYFVGALDRIDGVDVFANDRVLTSSFTWEVFLESPVFGSGYGSHTYFYQRTWGGDLAHDFGVLAIPTNHFINILADSGVLGLFSFMAFVAYVIFDARRNIYQAYDNPQVTCLIALSAWFLSFIIVNQTAAWLLPGSILSPMVFGVAGILVGAKLSRAVSVPERL